MRHSSLSWTGKQRQPEYQVMPAIAHVAAGWRVAPAIHSHRCGQHLMLGTGGEGRTLGDVVE